MDEFGLFISVNPKTAGPIALFAVCPLLIFEILTSKTKIL